MSTISAAVTELRPRFVLMCGIAFSTRTEAVHPIGRVLVSKQLMQYQVQRIGTSPSGERVSIPRGDRVSASPRVISRLRALAGSAQWQGQVSFGLVLSGDYLIDNNEFRQELRTIEPEAIGGEMEGSGLYISAQEHGYEWCVIKAVCDYADGEKGRDKERRQQVAAQNAAEFTIGALAAGGFAPKRNGRTALIVGALSLAIAGAGAWILAAREPTPTDKLTCAYQFEWRGRREPGVRPNIASAERCMSEALDGCSRILARELGLNAASPSSVAVASEFSCLAVWTPAEGPMQALTVHLPGLGFRLSHSPIKALTGCPADDGMSAPTPVNFEVTNNGDEKRTETILSVAPEAHLYSPSLEWRRDSSRSLGANVTIGSQSTRTVGSFQLRLPCDLPPGETLLATVKITSPTTATCGLVIFDAQSQSIRSVRLMTCSGFGHELERAWGDPVAVERRRHRIDSLALVRGTRRRMTLSGGEHGGAVVDWMPSEDDWGLAEMSLSDGCTYREVPESTTEPRQAVFVGVRANRDDTRLPRESAQ